MRRAGLLALLLVGIALGAEVSMLTEDSAEPAGEAAVEAAEGALDKELASDKVLPETDTQKVKAFGKGYTLKTFASPDCSGAVQGQKVVTGCANSPEIKECPKAMWIPAFECKETEKEHDNMYNQFWAWGVYKGNFVLKLDGNNINYKALSVGKETGSVGSQTCFQSISDIRDVFLENDINSPSCRSVDAMGVPDAEAKQLGENEVSLPLLGSFIIVPHDGPDVRSQDHLTAPHLAKPEIASPEEAPAKLEVPAEDHVYFSNFSHAEVERYDDGQASAADALMIDPSEAAENEASSPESESAENAGNN